MAARTELSRAVDVNPDLPRHADHNRAWFEITVDVRKNADGLAHAGLEPRPLGLPYDSGKGLYPGMIVYAVSGAMGANGLIGGHLGKGDGIPQLSNTFVAQRVDLFLTKVINAEPIGSEMDANDIDQLVWYVDPAIPGNGNVVLRRQQDIVRRMAKQDAHRAGMTSGQKMQEAISLYERVAVGDPGVLHRIRNWLRPTLAADRINELAMAQANSFMVDLWGQESPGKPDFYVALAREIHTHLSGRTQQLRGVNNPLQLGVALSLFRDRLDDVSWGPREGFLIGRARSGVGAPELQYGRMWRSLTRAALVQLVSDRLFNDTGAGSPAQMLVEAYKLYLSKAGMGEQSVKDAFASCRQHIRTEVISAADDIFDFAIALEPVYLHNVISQSANANVLPPVTNRKLNSQRTHLLVAAIVKGINAVSSGKANQVTLAELTTGSQFQQASPSNP